jgi:flagellar hook-associated protein 2 C-terminal domain protein
MATTNSSSVLRFSGMNSGLDTESIVNAMTAATKLKITKQNRKAITLKWKQEAYQGITTKLTDFQNKYLDMLNSKVNLKSKSTFTKYGATVSTLNADGILKEGTPAGVSVRSGTNAVPGTYKVKVLQTATQAKYQGSAMDASSLDLSQYSDASQNYSFNITVGTKSTVINFNGGSADSVRSQINSQLKDAYGSSNTSGQGLVYVNDSGKIISSDRQAMSLTGVANMYGNFTFDLNTSISAGTNKFNITVGDETVSVSFDSYTADYFNQTDSTTLGAQKREEFQGIYFDEQAEKLYNAAKADGSVDFDALKAQAYDKAKQADYDKKFESEKTKAMAEYDEELKTNYDNGIADGSIAEGTSFEDWKKTQAEFDENAFKTAFDEQYAKDFDETAFRAQFDKDYDELSAYKDTLNADDFKLSNEDLAAYANKHELNKAIGKVKLSDGTGLNIDENGTVTAANGKKLSVAADPATKNTFGASTARTTTAQVTTATTLKDLGVEDSATFTINGTKFTFTSDYTVAKMMSEINASKNAHATMTFSTLTNSFALSSSGYGTSASIEFSAENGSAGAELLSTLGLTSGTLTQGRNLQLEVNGETIETSSNSFTADGTTMTFTSAAQGAEFSYEVKKDNSSAIDAIKSFVEDYNKIIEEVYGQLDQKPNSDYYALTDDDIEDMDLSEKQQEKWEEKAKEGLLYNDSTVSTVMQKMRSVLYSTVKTADRQTFSLFSMGITTSDDWGDHGKLELDETKLEAAFEQYADQIADLFAGTTVDENGNTVKTGIMHKLDDVLTGAVKTTGARKDKGTLVQLAGTKTGTSATDNSIYDQLKSISTLISSLETRYEKQQDRYWKQFSNLETMMGSLNSQTSYIQQLMQF